jgi:DinB superfamily
MTVETDNKDWTWVLATPCPECQFDSYQHTRGATGSKIRANAQAWTHALERPDAATRFRDDRWSVLEYACHVRDVYRVYQTRVQRMLSEDAPHYDNWDQNQSATQDRYDAQDPSVVAAELAAAAETIAATFDSIDTPQQWERTGFRSDGSNFTVESISRYMLHDTIHHLVDVGLTPEAANPLRES